MTHRMYRYSISKSLTTTARSDYRLSRQTLVRLPRSTHRLALVGKRRTLILTNGGVVLNVSAGSRRSLILKRASRKGREMGSRVSLPSLSPRRRRHLPRQKIVRLHQRLKIKPAFTRSVSPMQRLHGHSPVRHGGLSPTSITGRAKSWK